MCKVNCQLSFLFISILISLARAASDSVVPAEGFTDLTDDPNYGVTWSFMPDGDGNMKVAFLTPFAEQPMMEVENGNITFHLFTKNSPSQLASGPMMGVESVLTSFDPNKWTKFIIHGWNSNETTPVIKELRDGYLATMDVNVIMVDWRDIANSWWYFGSARGTQVVGRVVADLIEYMVENMGASLERMHVVGFSLGAHAAGFTGSSMRSGKLARITGLDPAGPFFHMRGPSMKLDATDAQFVDVIHTASGTHGYIGDLGHVDFYPNGGFYQAGCWTEKARDREWFEACSHSRAPHYFTESIANNNFFAYGCRNFDCLLSCNCNTTEVVQMGEYVDTSARGVYYLEVASSSPFAKGPKTC